jgi:hypothetical protein
MDKVVILKIKTVPCEEKTWIHRSADCTVQCSVWCMVNVVGKGIKKTAYTELHVRKTNAPTHSMTHPPSHSRTHIVKSAAFIVKLSMATRELSAFSHVPFDLCFYKCYFSSQTLLQPLK